MNFRVALAACLLGILFPMAGNGEVWNLADDFSITRNPNGAWSYGWRATPGDPLVIYTDTNGQCHPDIDSWLYNISDFCPTVYHNPHTYPVTCLTITLQPNEAAFSPGPDQQAVARWTAPEDQTVSLTTHFWSLDTGSRIVYVYVNGTQMFTAVLDYLGETADYSGVFAVREGDVVDCAIFPISFYYDATALDFVLEAEGPTPVETTTWSRIKSTFR